MDSAIEPPPPNEWRVKWDTLRRLVDALNKKIKVETKLTTRRIGVLQAAATTAKEERAKLEAEVTELRAALAIYERGDSQWKVRAEKAEDMVARLRAVISEAQPHQPHGSYLWRLMDAALAKGGGDDAQG